MFSQKGVSIVICCYNSEKRIEPTLQHIFAQKQLEAVNCELIIVDNNSTDNTVTTCKKILKSYSHSSIKASMVSQPQSGLSFARKKGIETAVYDIVLFCDDDNWLNEAYVFRVFEFLENNKDYGVVGGCGVETCEVPPPKWFEYYKSMYAIGCRNDGDVTNVYGAGMAVRKGLVESLKIKLIGRKANLLTGGEDSEICFKIVNKGYKIRQLCSNTFYHFIPKERLTRSYLMRMATGRGASKAHLMLLKYKGIKKDTGLGYRLKRDLKDIFKAARNFNFIDIEFTLRRVFYYWKVMLFEK